MKALQQGIWSAETVADALYMRNGSQEVIFEYGLYRNGNFLRNVSGECTIHADVESEISQTASLHLYEEIQANTDVIRPVMGVRITTTDNDYSLYFITVDQWESHLNNCITWDSYGLTCDEYDTGQVVIQKVIDGYAKWTLGTFIPVSVAKEYASGRTDYAIEGYCPLVILKEDCVPAPLYLASGASYIESILNIISGSTEQFTPLIDSTSAVLSADREWEIGTSKLVIINELLKEIGYYPLFCDEFGRYRSMLNTEQDTLFNPQIEYKADTDSIIAESLKTTQDYFNSPNTFIAVVSQPDAAPLTSVYTNDSPAWPGSTYNIGRAIVATYDLDDIPDQASLDRYVMDIVLQSLSKTETITFETGLNPLHDLHEPLRLAHPAATGVYLEQRYEFPCIPGGLMSHTARKQIVL